MAPESTPPRILIIDDDAEIRYSLGRVLSSRHYQVHAAASGEEGLKQAAETSPDVIFLDNRMEGMSGIETLQHLRGLDKPHMIILMTAFGTTQTAIEAMKYGAFDYIVKPFNAKKVLALTEQALKSLADMSKASESRQPLLRTEDYKEGLVGDSEAMREVFKVIGQVAATEATVMVTGESGTGKELVARCLYQHSHRSGGPFMAVNCAAIPENLIESELFGHERGSFTGATNQRRGVFELCDGGTLFLDEIGDMAGPTQTKILRALQEGEIQRVGGADTIKVDVRLIAATNKDLEKMVEAKEFREDLYYRLNVVRLRLPPLRERLEDVPQLVDFMLQRLIKKRKVKARSVAADALQALSRYSWPGNVRELENVIHRSAVIAKGEMIILGDLPTEIQQARNGAAQPPKSAEDEISAEREEDLVIGSRESAPDSPGDRNGEHKETPPPPPMSTPPQAPPSPVSSALPASAESVPTPSFDDFALSDAYDLLYRLLRKDVDKALLQEIEREMIKRSLKEMNGNQVKTSGLLGITRATLRKRIDQYSLKIES